MIASFTRFMLVLQLVGIAGLALLLIKLQWVSSAVVALCIGAMLVTLPRSLIIWNNFFLSGAFRQPDQAGKPIGLIGKTMLFLQEFYWSSLCWLWTMPFKAFTSRMLPESAAMPVLLIHGYGANSGFWHHTSERLIRAGISHMAIELEPLLVSIDDYAGIIHAGIEKLCSVHRSEKVILLAHSMGGLAARAYLRKFGTERVARIITLGTPHYGSKLASYAIGINAMEMRWTAETAAPGWLTNLEKTESEAVRELITSIYSRHDNIVSPQASAHLPGATNFAFDRIGHVALAFDARVLDLVMREITAARRNR